jgi:hypothetical protein
MDSPFLRSIYYYQYEYRIPIYRFLVSPFIIIIIIIIIIR